MREKGGWSLHELIRQEETLALHPNFDTFKHGILRTQQYQRKRLCYYRMLLDTWTIESFW